MASGKHRAAAPVLGTHSLRRSWNCAISSACFFGRHFSEMFISSTMYSHMTSVPPCTKRTGNRESERFAVVRVLSRYQLQRRSESRLLSSVASGADLIR